MTILFIITSVLVVISFIANRTKTLKGLKKGAMQFLKILPTLLTVIIFVSIAMFFIPEEMILKNLGDETGLAGYAGAAIVGSISLIPGLISYPLAGMERKTEEEFAGSNTFPTRGTHLKTRAGYYTGLNEKTDHFLKLSGDWVTYLSFSQRPRVVYALRVGGEKLFGDYAFHQAATLGRAENLRGYRETRFYGDASLYLNVKYNTFNKSLE